MGDPATIWPPTSPASLLQRPTLIGYGQGPALNRPRFLLEKHRQPNCDAVRHEGVGRRARRLARRLRRCVPPEVPARIWHRWHRVACGGLLRRWAQLSWRAAPAPNRRTVPLVGRPRSIGTSAQVERNTQRVRRSLSDGTLPSRARWPPRQTSAGTGEYQRRPGHPQHSLPVATWWTAQLLSSRRCLSRRGAAVPPFSAPVARDRSAPRRTGVRRRSLLGLPGGRRSGWRGLIERDLECVTAVVPPRKHPIVAASDTACSRE